MDLRTGSQWWIADLRPRKTDRVVHAHEPRLAEIDQKLAELIARAACNACSIDLFSSSNNTIYHDNFNGKRAPASIDSTSIGNVWDDGYPSGGNYWSNYNGTDFFGNTDQKMPGSDGIGDTPFVLNAEDADRYPLMGVFNSYNVTYYTLPLVSQSCTVTVISNSTISEFAAPIWIEHPEVVLIMFKATGAEESPGFCRVSFPTAMMNETYHVFLNGTEIPYSLLPCSNETTSYPYFTYSHSTETITIVPEYLLLHTLLLFMLATLLAVTAYKKKVGKTVFAKEANADYD